MNSAKTLTIDGMTVEINGEKNLLELIRKVNIELPTFCYHSELSIYGACRLCMVDVEGRGLQAACSTPPEPGKAPRPSATGQDGYMGSAVISPASISGAACMNPDCRPMPSPTSSRGGLDLTSSGTGPDVGAPTPTSGPIFPTEHHECTHA